MNSTTKSDHAATALSGLCIFHCLALPVIASAAPFLAAMADAEWVHIFFASLATVISASVPFRDVGARGLSFVAPAGLGIAFLVAGVFAPEFGADETLLTVVGGVLLAAAHIPRMVPFR
ncbi:MerC domain-containing protein [Erythrobacter sp. SCSIO 43205]|uniref:MerC domain-containing protein n=1 Tax=Erythrobacter sp. SCSIO 43205 TaxID=2779361 RepID=UPI001CA9E71E|nr:MerC domain-containing protein [Erythrobacter sp. SCSIO 43205]UAB79398.1 MerC domain-containing protein [Erythrobacter sp. SCSIO 43205]